MKKGMFSVAAAATIALGASVMGAPAVAAPLSGATVGTPITVSLGTSPVDVKFSPDGATAYVLNELSQDVAVIDVANGSVVESIGFTGSPRALAISPDGATAYVTLWDADSVAVIDLDTRSLGTAIAVGDGPFGVAFSPDGELAYVSNETESTVSVIDVADGEVVGNPIAVGALPHAVAFSPDGARAYVASYGDNSVSVINTVSQSWTNTISLTGTGFPTGIVFSPDSTTAYVAHGTNLTVVNVNDPTVTTVVPLGSFTRGLAVSPDGSTLYIPQQNIGTVAVVTTTDKAVGTSLAVGSGPYAVAFSPTGAVAYVANRDSNSISVITLDPALTDEIVSTTTSPVTASVAAGSLTASLSAVEFAEVPFSHAAQSVSASAVLAADDETGLLYGWDVSIQSSPLAWTSPGDDTDAGRNISAANLTLAAVTAVDTVAGDSFVGTLGAGGALGSAISVVSTAPGEGSGSYTVPLTLSLAVPANAATGSYAGTLTTTISAAP